MSHIRSHVFVLSMVSALASCSAGSNGSGGDGSSGTGGSGGSGTGTGGSASGTGSTGSGTGGNVVLLDGGDNVPDGAEPEICDGEDNDLNGDIDDVDVGGDGICDCLNIATIGRLGPWGSGNVFAEWLDTRSPIGAVELDDQVLTEELLAPFQVIVVLNLAQFGIYADYGGTVIDEPAVSHVYSSQEASALENWVKGGGGLMTTVGYTDNEGVEVANVNYLLEFANMGYDTTQLDTDGDVTEWDPHPTTNGVQKARIINGARPLETGSGSTVAWDASGRAALRVAEIEGGRIAVWGDEWITYNSEWEAADLQIELLWLNLIKWLSPPAACQVPIPPQLY